jgi:HK97 family phage portal protein
MATLPGVASNVLGRLKHAWNALSEPKQTDSFLGTNSYNLGMSSSPFRPDRPRFSKGNEKSIVTAIYNRIAIDCSGIEIKHVRVDENKVYKEDMDSKLNDCITIEANKDQQSRAFFQDVVMSLFDEGCIAIVPIDTSIDPDITEGYDILSLRTGKITQWYPDHVQIEVYNDRTGVKQKITMPKNNVAIIENPHFAVMNEKNSVLQRLIRKLNILDAIDEQSGSGKLDLIVQLPYVVKTDLRQSQVDKRRNDLEKQLAESKFGIIYTDGAEKVTQLNRPVENNLLKQIEYLTSMLFSQLGVHASVLDGTANESVMLNFFTRTVQPIIAAITSEMNRKFLTKTARKQGQRIMYFQDPLRFATTKDLAEVADKFTRNEILTSNEIRQRIGMKPIDSPRANELRNKNLNEPTTGITGEEKKPPDNVKEPA